MIELQRNPMLIKKTVVQKLLIRYSLQTMHIVDKAIHQVVGQKSDFHGNSDFQNSQTLDPFQITAKKN